MIKKIERPDWHQMIWIEGGVWTEQNEKTRKKLRDWFDENIEPLNKYVENLVEAIDKIIDCDSCVVADCHWVYLVKLTEKFQQKQGIGIHPIKKESAEKCQ